MRADSVVAYAVMMSLPKMHANIQTTNRRLLAADASLFDTFRFDRLAGWLCLLVGFGFWAGFGVSVSVVVPTIVWLWHTIEKFNDGHARTNVQCFLVHCKG